MRIALAQLNPLVGDLLGNGDRILTSSQNAASQNVDLILTPELSLWGYPPRDLLLTPELIALQSKVLDHIANTFSNKSISAKILIGLAEPTKDHELPNLFNSIALVDKSGWSVIARKQLLPTYDVFDEKRYFRSWDSPSILEIESKGKSWKLGITICEDLWVEAGLQGQRLAGPDPIAKLTSKQLDLIINLSASPFSQSKREIRRSLAKKAVERLKCPLVYLNQVGGNDELIFDGSSFILNAQSQIIHTLANCREEIAIWDTTTKSQYENNSTTDPMEQLFHALVLGVRDYAGKCGFQSALIGLSGGIDSALVAILASAALGAEKVTAILMPSPWSSPGSIQDALNLAERIGLKTHTVPISSLMKSFNIALSVPLGKPPEGVTAENLQSRIRGTLLMALANQQGHLLLSTGNKSELAVGYCTLYGDMNGGLSVIGDLYKTSVFDLCNWIDSPKAKNARKDLGLPTNGALIGKAIREKLPSAELRPGQLDTDSLPDYEVLDPILKALIEERKGPDELIKNGHEPALISRVKNLLQKGEFKRKQAPPLLKVSDQAFGSGWRIPIATS